MTGFVQARPYDTGPAFDVLGTMASLSQVQRGQQQSALGGLQLQMEQQKAQLAREQLQKQQQYIAALPEDQRSLAGLDPSGYVGAMIDRLKPRAGVAVPEGGSVVDPYTGRVLLQGTPSVTWGDSSVGAGGGANLANARPAGAPGAPPAAGGPGVANGPPIPLTPYAAGIKAGENTTGNPAVKNPNSSAVGDHQFLDGTWLEVFKKYKPDLARGKSDAEILKLREQPGLSGEMADRYAQDNTAVLARGGFEATPVNLALAHRFGPAGALRVLQAEKQNPNAPLSSVMPEEVLQANPELRKMTIAQGRAAMEAQMGGAAAPGAAPAAAQAPAEAADPSSYDIRYDKGKPTEYPGKAGYVVARRKSDGAIIGVPAPTAGMTEAELQKRQELRLKEDEHRQKMVQDGVKDEREWRQEFRKPLETATELASQVGNIRNAIARGKGVGDIAAITAFNKLLDPQAVVREADVALTLKAQGLADRLAVWVANKNEGDVLPPNLRREMLEMSEAIYKTTMSVLSDRVMPYKKAVEENGGKWDRVIPPELQRRFGWDKPPEPPKQPGEKKEAGNYRPPPVSAAAPGGGVTVKVGDASAPELPALPPGFVVVP